LNSSKLCHNPLGEEDLEVSEEKLENDPVSEPDPEIRVQLSHIYKSLIMELSAPASGADTGFE